MERPMELPAPPQDFSSFSSFYLANKYDTWPDSIRDLETNIYFFLENYISCTADRISDCFSDRKADIHTARPINFTITRYIRSNNVIEGVTTEGHKFILWRVRFFHPSNGENRKPGILIEVTRQRGCMAMFLNFQHKLRKNLTSSKKTLKRSVVGNSAPQHDIFPPPRHENQHQVGRAVQERAVQEQVPQAIQDQAVEEKTVQEQAVQDQAVQDQSVQEQVQEAITQILTNDVRIVEEGIISLCEYLEDAVEPIVRQTTSDSNITKHFEKHLNTLLDRADIIFASDEKGKSKYPESVHWYYAYFLFRLSRLLYSNTLIPHVTIPKLLGLSETVDCSLNCIFGWSADLTKIVIQYHPASIALIFINRISILIQTLYNKRLHVPLFWLDVPSPFKKLIHDTLSKTIEM